MPSIEERKIINPAMDEQLREWIATANAAAPMPAAVDEPRRKVALDQAAYAFKNWLEDWRATAGAGLGRRDCLMALGLASRRPKKGARADANGEGSA
jgi:hypothetical protein